MPSNSITFITGNKGKLAEVQAILAPSSAANAASAFPTLANHALDLPELQGPSAQYIVIEKAKTAFTALGGQTAVLIEDTSLCFDALQGLPGPYIKWFLDKLKPEGLAKMVQGYPVQARTGKAVCIFALCTSLDSVQLFEGVCEGNIVAPRSDGEGFGWDPIFEPLEQQDGDGSGSQQRKTFAEMSKDEKNRISHRSKALALLRAHFEGKDGKRPREE